MSTLSDDDVSVRLMNTAYDVHSHSKPLCIDLIRDCKIELNFIRKQNTPCTIWYLQVVECIRRLYTDCSRGIVLEYAYVSSSR